MEIAEILKNPRVQEVIALISKNCTDKTTHHDNYSFLIGICDVCTNGETKTVFLYKDWDFVIKVPNYYSYPHHNYCAIEAENYAKAAAYNIQRVLLETALLLVLPNGIKLYVQPRYTTDQCDLHRDMAKRKHLHRTLNNLDSNRTREIAKSMYDGYRISLEWMARVIQLYGKKFARSLEKWTQDNRIGDLHSRNVGWIKNRPIILDYSGYFG